jgi:drug/metabolite transporter (DMT)-like permease
MFTGILFGTIACMIWGLIFLIPDQLIGFSSFEVALGRYFFFGLLSFVLFLRSGLKMIRKYSFKYWRMAFFFGLVANLLYYTALVLGSRYASSSLAALVLGLTPIVISVFGNLQQKQVSFKSLLIPSLLIALGLFLVNLPALTQNNLAPEENYLLGCFFCFFALISWSLYAVVNAKKLREDSNLSSSDWVTMIGLGTFVWTILGAVVYVLFIASTEDLSKYGSFSTEVQQFVIGTAVLGIVCGWIGSYLWNRASALLPVSMLGQLLIFETVFGLLFVNLYAGKWPPAISMAGMLLMLSGIFISLVTLKNQTDLKMMEE